MLTSLAKTLNYISSLLLLYPLLVLRIILFSDPPSGNLWLDVMKPNLLLLIVLLVLFIVALFWMVSLHHWKNNTLVSGRATKNITFEMAVFFVAYVLPLLTIDAGGWKGLVGNLVVFVVIGIAFVRSDEHFLNPTFLLFGYKLYQIDDKKILSKETLDALNIRQAESLDGISAREIVRNTYIILPR